MLLTKIYPKGSQEYYKMVKAYNLMVTAKCKYQQRDYKINVNLYENLRVELSKALSISQTGKGNSQYGTFWIYNPNTRISKKVPKGYIVDGDWEIGYVTNLDNHFSQKHCVECGKKGVLKKSDAKTCSIECKRELLRKSIDLSTKRNKSIFYNDIELIFDKTIKIDLDQIEKFVVKYTESKSIPKSIEYMGRGVSKANYKLARYLIEEIKI